jgi:hypothetical protein
MLKSTQHVTAHYSQLTLRNTMEEIRNITTLPTIKLFINIISSKTTKLTIPDCEESMKKRETVPEKARKSASWIYTGAQRFDRVDQKPATTARGFCARATWSRLAAPRRVTAFLAVAAADCAAFAVAAAAFSLPLFAVSKIQEA